eukprot:gene10362-13147_t
MDASAPLGQLLPTSATLLRELKSTGDLDFPLLGAEPDATWLTLISRGLNLDTTLRVSLSGPNAEAWRQGLIDKGVRAARLETATGETQGLHLQGERTRAVRLSSPSTDFFSRKHMLNNDRLLVQILLLVLFGASFWVMAPFWSALFWGAVLAFASWPLMRLLTRALGGRESLAAGILTLGWMLLVAVPLVWLGFNLADHVRDAVALIKDVQVDGLPEAPTWL